MKTIMSIVLVCAAFFSLSAHAQNTPAEYALFEKEVDRISEQQKANKIGRTMAYKEKLVAAKTYMPGDKITQDYINSLIGYSEQLDSKKINKSEYDALKEARDERFLAAMKDMRESNERAYRQAELENDRMRQAQASTYANAAQQYRTTAATATMLNGIDRAFTNSFGQSITPPPQICDYYGGTRYCY
ncbi:hypothetical protein [Polynucleobacter sp. 35-46-11]|uniref:hypothetical protein n=1 Tax=Polynucleobacter sp. 35-46-11 TaxID=1970425 RepID=UPI0025E8CAF5|nr:hypothetical protein [Polynucleobacter sp. 35-46-11]